MHFDYGDDNNSRGDFNLNLNSNGFHVIMLTPIDIHTSQDVIDYVLNGYVVICNLINNDKNQRIVDYISGGVYALGGRIEPMPVKTSFVCTPKSVVFTTPDNFL